MEDSKQIPDRTWQSLKERFQKVSTDNAFFLKDLMYLHQGYMYILAKLKNREEFEGELKKPEEF